MPKMQIRAVLFYLSLVLLPLASRAAVEDPSQLLDRIVAVVDQEVILWSELNVRLDLYLRYSGYTFTPPEKELNRLRGQLLDEMINEQVLILKAKRDSLVIENSRVEELLVSKLSEMKSEAGSENFPKMLERIGFSERQLKTHLRKSIRDQLLMEQMQRVLASRVNITHRDVEAFRQALSQSTDLPVVTWDERFSTQEAERLMRESGRQPSREKGQSDAVAAAVILQTYLDSMRKP